MKYIIVFLCGAVLFLGLNVHADDSGAFSESAFVSELQKGGYVLFLRHFQTNVDQADTDPLNLENVKAQRQLTDEGRQKAVALGEAFRILKIPIGKVIASKFYRAYETGGLLKVGEVVQSIDVSEGGLVVSPRENQRRAKALQLLFSELPPAGKNHLIVSHRPNLQDAAGKQFGDTGEGEVVVFKPLGTGKFELVARVAPPEKWSAFVK
jgi:phosphohistidine phosphatase SixA